MTTVTITLRDEDREFIQAAMKSGRYASESEAVADAIAELRARERLLQARMTELENQIAVGIEQLDRGEGTEWNPGLVRTKGEAILARRQSAS